MTHQAHATAILDLLRADSDLRVMDGAVTTGTRPPYVVVYLSHVTPGGEQALDSSSLTGDSQRTVIRAYCHCVGETAAAARIVAGRVAAALLDVKPTVPGRVCFPIRQDDGQPASRDESTGVRAFDQVDVYRLETVRA